MAKVAFIVALALCCVLAIDASAVGPKTIDPRGVVPDLGSDPEKSYVDWYSCAGKADGNYVHPSDCTKFMSCVAQHYAYERNCADCHVNPANCPTGRLHYHHPEDACLWSYEAGCVTDPLDPVTEAPPTEEPATEEPATEEPATEEPATEGPATEEPATEEPVTEDPSCDPDDCWVDGYCHDYTWCERDESDHKGKGKNGRPRSGRCDDAENLYFNPNKNAIHGGVCDFWENLSDETKKIYNEDKNCIDPHCEWRPDPDSPCSSTYWYFHPEQNGGVDKEMHCPQRPDGEHLIWDQARKSCHPCQDVTNSITNEKCC